VCGARVRQTQCSRARHDFIACSPVAAAAATMPPYFARCASALLPPLSSSPFRLRRHCRRLINTPTRCRAQAPADADRNAASPRAHAIRRFSDALLPPTRYTCRFLQHDRRCPPAPSSYALERSMQRCCATFCCCAPAARAAMSPTVSVDAGDITVQRRVRRVPPPADERLFCRAAMIRLLRLSPRKRRDDKRCPAWRRTRWRCLRAAPCRPPSSLLRSAKHEAPRKRHTASLLSRRH